MQQLYNLLFLLLALAGCNKVQQMGMGSCHGTMKLKGGKSSHSSSKKTSDQHTSAISFFKSDTPGFLDTSEHTCVQCGYSEKGPAKSVIERADAHYCNKKGCENCLELYKCTCPCSKKNKKKNYCSACCGCSKPNSGTKQLYEYEPEPADSTDGITSNETVSTSNRSHT